MRIIGPWKIPQICLQKFCYDMTPFQIWCSQYWLKYTMCCAAHENLMCWLMCCVLDVLCWAFKTHVLAHVLDLENLRENNCFRAFRVKIFQISKISCAQCAEVWFLAISWMCCAEIIFWILMCWHMAMCWMCCARKIQHMINPDHQGSTFELQIEWFNSWAKETFVKKS